MEFPEVGVKLDLQLPAYTTATATAMLDLNRICNLPCGLQQHQVLDPLSEARDWTCVLVDTSRVLNSLSHNENSRSQFLIISSPSLFLCVCMCVCVSFSPFPSLYPTGSIFLENPHLLISCLIYQAALWGRWVRYHHLENEHERMQEHRHLHTYTLTYTPHFTCALAQIRIWVHLGFFRAPSLWHPQSSHRWPCRVILRVIHRQTCDSMSSFRQKDLPLRTGLMEEPVLPVCSSNSMLWILAAENSTTGKESNLPTSHLDTVNTGEGCLRIKLPSKKSSPWTSHCGSVGPKLGQEPNRVSMRMQVGSLASLSGLRIWCCHELWCRSQMWLGSGVVAIM